MPLWRKTLFSHLVRGLLVCAIVPGMIQSAHALSPRPNFLFIVSDDQRPNLGCYGDPLAKTPALDRLAREGILFKHAYCQYPMCGPSRASLLTGLRPDTVQVYDLHTPVRRPRPDVLTLPQYFKQRGYHTQAIGKVFHPGIDDPESWSVPTFDGPEIVGTTNVTSGTEDGPARHAESNGKRGPSWYAPDLPDDHFHDGIITSETIKTLGKLKDQPFFLAVGFNRPHLPFVAPKRYFDLYRNVDFPVMPTQAPEHVPGIAMTQSGELRQYRDIPRSGPLDTAKSRELVHAYYACTSFVDAQVGRLLDELDNLGLAQNTIVVFWGDHGFHLGEQGIWAKYSNFEAATRSPLIIKAPKGQTSATVHQVVEFVDVFPTLVEMGGGEPPEALEGDSLAGYIRRDMMRIQTIDSNDAALTQVNRGDGMGYSLRTNHYRYTEWRRKDGSVQARELYDYERDPGESKNLSDAPEARDIISQLATRLGKILAGDNSEL